MKKSLNDIHKAFHVKKYLDLKKKSKEELEALLGENYANMIHNSKSGYITLTKTSENPGYVSKGDSHSGWVGCFAEGLSCVILYGDRWFHTSVIKDIDWENNILHTMNSTYEFEFTEYDADEMLKAINL